MILSRERLADVRARLSAVREQRARPSRDDKVVAAWNSWLICSLIDAAMVFNEPTWLDAPEPPESCWRVHWSMPGCAGPLLAGQVGSAPASSRITRLLPKPACGWRPPSRSDVAGTRPGTLRCDSEPVR